VVLGQGGRRGSPELGGAARRNWAALAAPLAGEGEGGTRGSPTVGLWPGFGLGRSRRWPAAVAAGASRCTSRSGELPAGARQCRVGCGSSGSHGPNWRRWSSWSTLGVSAGVGLAAAAMMMRRSGSGQWRPWTHTREGADGFYRPFMWSRGNSHRGTAAPRQARTRRAEQRVDRCTKSGAAGRRVRVQHVACADLKVPWEGAGFLGKAQKGSDAEGGRGLARARALWPA
jgi:hypothetical protein